MDSFQAPSAACSVLLLPLSLERPPPPPPDSPLLQLWPSLDTHLCNTPITACRPTLSTWKDQRPSGTNCLRCIHLSFSTNRPAPSPCLFPPVSVMFTLVPTRVRNTVLPHHPFPLAPSLCEVKPCCFSVYPLFSSPLLCPQLTLGTIAERQFVTPSALPFSHAGKGSFVLCQCDLVPLLLAAKAWTAAVKMKWSGSRKVLRTTESGRRA